MFPRLPGTTRYYRILKNLERIFADMALVIGMQSSGMFVVDPMPLPIRKGPRWKRLRAMTEAASGRYSLGKMYGLKLHGVINLSGMLSRFAIGPANEHDVGVAKVLLADLLECNYLGDKGYVGSVVYTQGKHLNPWPRPDLLAKARKLIETVYSSLNRTKNIALGQLNSLWNIRCRVCPKNRCSQLGAFPLGYHDPLALEV